jgi:hypothetical protein
MIVKPLILMLTPNAFRIVGIYLEELLRQDPDNPDSKKKKNEIYRTRRPPLKPRWYTFRAIYRLHSKA